jgi:hypothetical protein|tara:strand:- start:489 stop:761 length:273 start_codon:yes stop_codon:yes gene_type:complete
MSCLEIMTASIGDRLRLKQQLPYLKTADPMPMLRPSDLVSLDEVGEVVALHPLDTVAVRFRRGTYLISLDQLEAAAIGDDAQDDVDDSVE